MKLHLQSASLVAAFAFAGIASAFGQGMPTSQPNLVTIIREQVKVGRMADHARHEAGWPVAFAKAKSTDYYLAFSSLTGANEVWYVVPWESHAAIAKSMNRETDDKKLAAALERLARDDARYVDSIQTLQARARPDLSLGTFPDLSLARYAAVSILRVRPGHEGDFEAAAKAYGAARKRAQPDASFRVYQVIAGMPGPTFLVFSTVKDYAEFDRIMAADQAAFKGEGSSAEDLAAMAKFRTEALINAEVQRFRIDPQQSYVAPETRAKDPAFWNGK